MTAATNPPRRPPLPHWVIKILGVALALFTLAEVNYPQLGPQSQLAIFALLGLGLCFLLHPVHPRWANHPAARWLDRLLLALTVFCCGYVLVQSEPAFSRFHLAGQSLGDRAGIEQGLDIVVGVLGLLLVLEAARRTVGLALPILAIAFLTYAYLGPSMPSWLFPHRGYGLERIVAHTFLHSQGVFGVALRVMFSYVFLFIVLGAFLEATGATRFIIDYARRLFAGSSGGPAKVSILSSGLMGSLSGSAVANTATTGTFTIPLMKSAGFRPSVAAGLEAAASSGGALVPPVMGAGAYMMLELVDPPVTYLEIVRSALLPALLYYLSLFWTVHFWARRIESAPMSEDEQEAPLKATRAAYLEGIIFAGGLGVLLAFLFAGYTVFRAVSLGLVAVIALSYLRQRTRITPRRALEAFHRAARGGVTLVAASACVGIVIGVVTLTGVGTKLPATILPLAEQNLLLALVLLMTSSIVLGMGLPSVVCYLLLATLVGPALSGLGVVPLAAHLFIFYFGLMSMVTPPVALAAYTAASIADAGIMRTGFAAFRFALVGFALPFLFIYRPALLMLAPDGGPASAVAVIVAFVVAALAILPMAAASAGHLAAPLGPPTRLLLLLAAVLLFLPGGTRLFAALPFTFVNLSGLILLAGVAFFDRRAARLTQTQA